MRICSAPAEINSRVLLHFFFVAKQEHVVNISFPPITLSSTDTFTFTHCQMKPQLKMNTCSTCSLVQYNRVLGPHLGEEKKKTEIEIQVVILRKKVNAMRIKSSF